MIPTEREAMARAEDRWLEPPAEIEPEMGECLRCNATGQIRPQGMGGAWSDCPECDGSGQVELGPYEEEYELD